MKVLVTGANGFVGMPVCRRLLAENWQVRGALRREVGLPMGVTACRIQPIGPETNWVEALVGVDAVVHLAARVHVMRETAADPLEQFRRANRGGTRRLAEEAARMGVRRFVFMSSIKVNGESTPEAPFRADDEPAPADPYGQSKWEAEQELRGIADDSGMHVTILRPPLVYGPGVGGNLRSLLRAVKAGWPLPLGAVNNRRSLIYVENLADAVATVLREPAGSCETFLVRDGEDVSTPELIRRLARLMNRRACLPAVPPSLLELAGRLMGKGDAVSRLIGSLSVDDGAIRARLGWTPPYSLGEGLAATAAWFLAPPPRSAATSS